MKKLILVVVTIGALVFMGFKIQEKPANKPFKIYREGNSKVVVWENTNADNQVWYNYQVEKEYKKGDEIKYSNSFNESELKDLKVVLDKAIQEISETKIDNR